MTVMKGAVPFTVSLVGEVSGETWSGVFKCKPRLSHRDQLTKDRIRRELLGPDAVNATDRALNQAEIFAQLAVRVVESPSWWSGNGGGLDLADDNVVRAVFDECVRIEDETINAIKKSGEDAKVELEKIAKQG